jgi:hypothetical protein
VDTAINNPGQHQESLPLYAIETTPVYFTPVSHQLKRSLLKTLTSASDYTLLCFFIRQQHGYRPNHHKPTSLKKSLKTLQQKKLISRHKATRKYSLTFPAANWQNTKDNLPRGFSRMENTVLDAAFNHLTPKEFVLFDYVYTHTLGRTPSLPLGLQKGDLNWQRSHRKITQDLGCIKSRETILKLARSLRAKGLIDFTLCADGYYRYTMDQYWRERLLATGVGRKFDESKSEDRSVGLGAVVADSRHTKRINSEVKYLRNHLEGPGPSDFVDEEQHCLELGPSLNQGESLSIGEEGEEESPILGHHPSPSSPEQAISEDGKSEVKTPLSYQGLKDYFTVKVLKNLFPQDARFFFPNRKKVREKLCLYPRYRDLPVGELNQTVLSLAALIWQEGALFTGTPIKKSVLNYLSSGSPAKGETLTWALEKYECYERRLQRELSPPVVEDPISLALSEEEKTQQQQQLSALYHSLRAPVDSALAPKSWEKNQELGVLAVEEAVPVAESEAIAAIKKVYPFLKGMALESVIRNHQDKVQRMMQEGISISMETIEKFAFLPQPKQKNTLTNSGPTT